MASCRRTPAVATATDRRSCSVRSRGDVAGGDEAVDQLCDGGAAGFGVHGELTDGERPDLDQHTQRPSVGERQRPGHVGGAAAQPGVGSAHPTSWLAKD